MNELLKALAEDFDDAEGSIRIVTADWFSDDLRLDLAIQFNDDRSELWEVTCFGVVDESLRSIGYDTLIISTDSPLLKPFMEREVPIMFSQNAMEPETFFGLVCSCCIEVMGRPDSIPRFLNGAPTGSGICSSEYGLLGQFPESLAVRILAALKGKPIQANLLPGHQPSHWNGSDHVAYQGLQTLELGDSYVIASKFSALRA